MELSIFHSDKYVVAGISQKNKCLVEEFLNDLDGNYSSNVDGILALMERISKEGLDHISSKLCHEADKNEKIYELIKGKIRIYFFKGQGNQLVICTSGIIKKTQKVDPKEVEKAINFKNAYFDAVSKNKIVILED